jgi:hypothetical protein
VDCYKKTILFLGFRITVPYLTAFDFTVEAAEALGSDLTPGIVY